MVNPNIVAAANRFSTALTDFVVWQVGPTALLGLYTGALRGRPVTYATHGAFLGLYGYYVVPVTWGKVFFNHGNNVEAKIIGLILGSAVGIGASYAAIQYAVKYITAETPVIGRLKSEHEKKPFTLVEACTMFSSEELKFGASAVWQRVCKLFVRQ